jgi:hypothetical protein
VARRSTFDVVNDDYVDAPAAAPPNPDPSLLLIHTRWRSSSSNAIYVSAWTSLSLNLLSKSSFLVVVRPSSVLCRCFTTSLCLAEPSALDFSTASVSQLIEPCTPLRATADVTLEDVACVPPFELVFDGIAENEVKALLDLEAGSESEMSSWVSAENLHFPVPMNECDEVLRTDFVYRVSSYSTGFYSRLRASIGGFKVATYFILIFYLTGFYC